MGTKRYKITIIEESVETVIAGKQWAKQNDTAGVDYAYTPEIEKQQAVTREIYTQNTDELDLIEVIKAVNGI